MAAGAEFVKDRSTQWVEGTDVLGRMTPEWRDNLGPADMVRRMFERYKAKVLWLDSASTARADLVLAGPGYQDATFCWHNTVEEGYFLEGRIEIADEGTFGPGDYFWRPPGFIHSAFSETGFKAIFFLEGNNPSEGSRAADRNVSRPELAGTNALEKDFERAVGPRGWVRHARASHMPWTPGSAYARTQDDMRCFDVDHSRVKVLSSNVQTGAQTILLRLDPGFSLAQPLVSAPALTFLVLEGTLQFGGEMLVGDDFARVPSGTPLTALAASGATLLVKSDGRLKLTPA